MLRSAFQTFSAKLLIAALNFFTALITARYLGAEGRGIVSIFVLNISIVHVFCSISGGPGLVYLFPRMNAPALFAASYVWAAASCIVVPYIIYLLGYAEENLVVHLAALSLLHFIVRIHLQWLLSNQKLRQFNGASAVFPVVMFLMLLVYFVVLKQQTVFAFVSAYYIAITVNLVLTSAILMKNNALGAAIPFGRELSSTLRMGYVIQGGNLMQLLNYRFSYFIIQSFFGKAQVGIFSMAVSFAEACWLIANSFAVLQYSRISNSKDDSANRLLTRLFLRISFWLTLIAVIFLMFLPASFFATVLGGEFSLLPEIFPWLASGIVVMVISIVLAHYFSGSGNPKAGATGSAAGLILTIACGFILIPRLGITGAAITASLSYFASALTLIFLFNKKAKIRFRDFILKINDLNELRNAGLRK